ncbi:DUF5659 domain-containing protein [Sporosarcina sp. SAFN-010]|uniref:DUF5659 domain-containing protein n=1 Tax=Sporosarcina sp. SAFN-010 TaxID=3387273 RepID=UPI003F7E9A35
MKCILSFRVAKYLLAQGCKLIDIDTSHKVPGNVVFIFEQSQQLSKALSQLPKIEEIRKGQ